MKARYIKDDDIAMDCDVFRCVCDHQEDGDRREIRRKTDIKRISKRFIDYFFANTAAHTASTRLAAHPNSFSMPPKIPFSQYVRQNKSAVGIVFMSTMLIGCAELLRQQTNDDPDKFNVLKSAEQIDLLKRSKVDHRNIPSNIVYTEDPVDDNRQQKE